MDYAKIISFDTFRPSQNSHHFTNDIFLNENVWISLKISLKFLPKVQIINIPALVQIMAWHQAVYCRKYASLSLNELKAISLHSQIITYWCNVYVANRHHKNFSCFTRPKMHFQQLFKKCKHDYIKKFYWSSYIFYWSSNFFIGRGPRISKLRRVWVKKGSVRRHSSDHENPTWSAWGQACQSVEWVIVRGSDPGYWGSWMGWVSWAAV